MTISDRGADLLHVSGGSRAAGLLARATRRDSADRHLQRVHRAEGVDLPPEPHLRLIGDLMEYTDANMPRYKPLSVSGYHIREAGATAAQELAFTLARWLLATWSSGQARGLDVDRFAPGLSFFFDARHRLLLRKSRSSAPHAVSGRGGCATACGATSARAQWLRFTPRPPGSR